MSQLFYYGLGSLINGFFKRRAGRLDGLFHDLKFEEYAGRSHFVPHHTANPEHFAAGHGRRSNNSHGFPKARKRRLGMLIQRKERKNYGNGNLSHQVDEADMEVPPVT